MESGGAYKIVQILNENNRWSHIRLISAIIFVLVLLIIKLIYG